MEGIVLIIALAIITEALIEYGKSIGSAFVSKNWKTAATQLIAIIVSVLLCFAANANLFATVGINFVWPWLGVVLTGVIGSRGANYVSDFVKKLNITNKE